MDQSAEANTLRAPGEFVFRGNAVAAGGYLTKLNGVPVELDRQRVTVHGESSLPLIGGISHSLVVKPDLPFPEFIQYGEASTIVEGLGDAYSKVTNLHAAVRNVRVTTSPSKPDAVPTLKSISFVADRLAISARSTHPAEGQPDFQLLDAPDTSGMSLVLAPFEGSPVVVPLRLVIDPAFLSRSSMDDLDARFMKDREFFDDQGPCLQSPEPLVFEKSRLPRTVHGFVRSSFVTRIFRGDKEIRGNVLVEKGFGTITFGTLLMDEYSRRVSLVRIKMGSDPEGLSAFAGADSNGIWN
jgi:hypothetical protein